MTKSGFEYPAPFVERMRGMLGADLPPFLAALTDPPEGLRVNTLRLAPAEFERITPFPVRRLPFPGEGFIVERVSRPGKHPYHSAGVYYVQDPGAMVVGALVEARAGERILDLAAAPGGKATHLAATMGGHGLLVANDVNRSRASELAGNLERCGVGNAVVTSASVGRLAAHFGAYFDRVLVDAPCSGESMFHKSAAALNDWSPAAVQGCARRQSDLLHDAARLVRPEGLLVYSTCTFGVEENEEVASRFLESSEEFEPAPLAAVAGADPVRFSPDNHVGAGQRASAYRLWPHRVAGAGHFVAAFRRSGGEPDSTVPQWRHTIPRDSARLYAEFSKGLLQGEEIDPGRLIQLGRELYRFPDPMPDVRGLRVVRPGLRLGTVEPKRFEPAHAFAMWAPPERFASAVRLELEDPRVRAYLHGAPIQDQGTPGWLPILVDGFALGWGKRVGATVKNHYPKGLRWRS